MATGTAISTIQVQAIVTNYLAGGTVFTNSVTAATTANETVTANNTARAATRILAPALSIAKMASPSANVEYHGQVTYTVTVNNSGELDASTVLLTDTLPTAVDFARWVDQPAGASVTADEVTWNGTVSASQAITFTFVVTHVGNHSDIVTNTARYEHSSSSGSADAVFTVMSGSPDLSLAKSAAPNTHVAYHGEVTYTVTLNNGGASDASGVAFTDTLPLSTTLARWVNQPAGAVGTSGEITWTGVVSSGQAVNFMFVVTQTGDYGQVITNTAYYHHASGSGSSSARFTIVAAPNLSASTKIASPTGVIKPGAFVTYTITLSNTGGVNASPRVTDVLGSYYTVYNALDFAQNPTGTLTWTGVVTAGQSVTLRFVAQVKSLTQLPVGQTTLANSMAINDGVNVPFNVSTTSAPSVKVYGIYVPVIRK